MNEGSTERVMGGESETDAITVMSELRSRGVEELTRRRVKLAGSSTAANGRQNDKGSESLLHRI